MLNPSESILIKYYQIKAKSPLKKPEHTDKWYLLQEFKFVLILGDLLLYFNILTDQKKNMTISDTEKHFIKFNIYSY